MDYYFWIIFSWITYCLGYATVPVDLVLRLFCIRDMFMVVEADVVYERCRQMKTQCFASRKALERSGNFSEMRKMVHKGLTRKDTGI